MSAQEKSIKNILLGVSGGIASYKTAHLIRLLKKQGLQVKVVMTDNAKQFITPLTLQTLAEAPVTDNLFDLETESSSMAHIRLAKWADLMLIAPASANCLAKLTHGLADDLLTTLALATQASLYVAPAMNQVMWHASATQSNIRLLKDRNIRVLGPGIGEQACGDNGYGRMLEPEELLAALPLNTITAKQTLKNVRILITAGPTQEPIDPVRYLSNRSSGKMGYALAKAAQQAGACVTLISGPVAEPTPITTGYIAVNTAKEMLHAVKQAAPDHDVFISAAAVADYRIQDVFKNKIKKTDNLLQLSLEKNPDILSTMAKLNQFKYLVGFAAETENLEYYAQQKLITKKIDMICANPVGRDDSGFDSPYNELLVLTHQYKEKFAKQPKDILAEKLIATLARNYYEKYPIKNSQ